MGALRLTLHAREEMNADTISTSMLINALCADSSEIIEDYPEDRRGHSHLILAWDQEGRPIHVCSAVHEGALVIITVYRPHADLWQADWRTRK